MRPILKTVFFSPTGSSKTVALAISDMLSTALSLPVVQEDWTKPSARSASLPSFGARDLLIFSFPVYAGRVPPLLTPLLRALHASATPAIILAVYGNRDYDDALLEAHDLLTEGGFRVVGAGAFIGEHSYSDKVGTDRPDANDLQVAKEFAVQLAEKLRAGNPAPVAIKGNFPYKATDPSPDCHPETTDACNGCGLCVSHCPLALIDPGDPSRIATGCLRCCACVKACPQHAKQLSDPRTTAFRAYLESACLHPRTPELFL